MNKTPKSLRLQIGLFGRTNTGKSSFLNYITGQEVSITSSEAGTTTDIVEKPIELLPVGPVVFLDTGGVDDLSDLGELRIQRTRSVLDRMDIMVLITLDGIWDSYEEVLLEEARTRNIPVICVVNKTDLSAPGGEFLKRIGEQAGRVMCVSCLDSEAQDEARSRFKQHLIELLPRDFLSPPPLAGDLVSPGETAVLIVPIDLQAPKGRLILPQVQVIREMLDSGVSALVARESEYPALLANLKNPPALAVCDSQVVDVMMAHTPESVPATTFSILFARFKGDLEELARGAGAIDRLQRGDRVLIAESCTHHPAEDDIGREKIPRWLREYTGLDLDIEIFAGRDYPEDLSEYRLIIHCGGCMLNRREMLSRIRKAREAGTAVTNYGTAISKLHNVLERALSPFPDALKAYRETAIPAAEPVSLQGE